MRFVSTVWVQEGQWVAWCGHPDCSTVEGAPHPTNPALCGSGAILRYGQPVMTCTGCGSESSLVWPDNPGGIMNVLNRRIVPATRNWLPHETVADLEAENRAHPIGVN